MRYLRVDPASYSATERASLLIDALKQRSALFILDGFERELKGYGYRDIQSVDRSDAIHTAPSSCIDPSTSYFLRYLVASEMRSRIIFTSRIIPRDIESASLSDTIILEKLSERDAIFLLRKAGVIGLDASILLVCQRYDFHPLALRVLGGLIKKGILSLNDPIVVAGDCMPPIKHDECRHALYKHAYDSLTESQRRILEIVSLFRLPISCEFIGLFISEETCNIWIDLTTLIEIGFLQPVGQKIFDMHPIIKAFIYQHLAEKCSLHARAFELLSQGFIDKSGPTRKTIDWTLEAVHHATGAQLYDQAFSIFQPLWPILYSWGVFVSIINSLLPLVPNNIAHENKLKVADSVIETSLWLGISFHKLGNLTQANRYYARFQQSLFSCITARDGVMGGASIKFFILNDFSEKQRQLLQYSSVPLLDASYEFGDISATIEQGASDLRGAEKDGDSSFLIYLLLSKCHMALLQFPNASKCIKQAKGIWERRRRTLRGQRWPLLHALSIGQARFELAHQRYDKCIKYCDSVLDGTKSAQSIAFDEKCHRIEALLLKSRALRIARVKHGENNNNTAGFLDSLTDEAMSLVREASVLEMEADVYTEKALCMGTYGDREALYLTHNLVTYLDDSEYFIKQCDASLAACEVYCLFGYKERSRELALNTIKNIISREVRGARYERALQVAYGVLRLDS